VTTFNAAGSALLFSTYLGGPYSDVGTGVALDTARNLYVSDFTYLGAPLTGGVYEIGPSINISAPTSVTAGTAIPITVSAVTGSGAVNQNYTGTVHFSSSDALAVLPADYTFSSADQGVHTFTVTLKRAGTQGITATDTVTGAINGSASVSVAPAAAVMLVITGPSSVSAGTPFSITVTALDAYGNTATGYTGTVHLSDSAGGATLPGNYTFTSSDQGVHTFTKLKLKTTGWQTITAMDTQNNSILGTWLIDVI
jgi:hypothetical protein